jgi:predicted regulator of Ras-like GTPase activity (Roadblock/LC7/MglB family)
MFNESIIDYNGHKLLMSRIKKDLILLLMLKKSAYLGLTMLDIEGCLREIDKNLDEGTFGIREIPG